LWRIAATLPDEAAADAAATLIGQVAQAVSAFETVRDGPWLVQGFATEKPARSSIAAGLAMMALAHGIEEPALMVDLLPNTDWLKLNRESFTPMRIGRYFVHGSHIDRLPLGGWIPLKIDAATAFGTGEHATTHGCLRALGAMTRPRGGRILDMGCGTGILAIAAAKTWRAPVLACDIDPHSVAVACENIRANTVENLIRCVQSDGYRSRAVRAGAPYDLIFANILARPLVGMARDLALSLAPGGTAILSGLLANQENFVAAAHRSAGLRLVKRIAIDGWHTLVWRQPG